MGKIFSKDFNPRGTVNLADRLMIQNIDTSENQYTTVGNLPFATNASIGLAAFAKNASLGLYTTNASIGLAAFAKNASLGFYVQKAGDTMTGNLTIQNTSNPFINIKDSTSTLFSSFAIASAAGAYSALAAANDTVFRCYNSYMLFTSQGTISGGFRWTTKPSGTEIERMTMLPNGNLGIGTATPTSKLQVVGLPVYANNAAAITGGLTVGAFYRTGGNPDPVCVVH